MKPIIPWTIANDVSAAHLAARFLEIVKSILKSSTYKTLQQLPDSTVNATCIKMFNNLAPEGFSFGLNTGVWGFHRLKETS